MAKQTEIGKAFEYACLKALEEALKHQQSICIEQTPALKTASSFYQQISTDLRNNLDKAAQASARLIFRLEPRLENPENNVPLYLSIQEDSQGQAGDVRDILCVRKQNSWEIGFSCKHNHSAVKHSRLSGSLDFGKEWFGLECSSDYFAEIAPIFQRLTQEKAKNTKWRDISDKGDSVYLPILNAFMRELKRLDSIYPNEISSSLLKYLLGRNDFYKIISIDKDEKTQIQAYNLFGTLNQPAGSIKAQTKVPQLKLPTKIHDISLKDNSNTTILVTCDNGWALSFRIHNASSTVEPSLKFDIQLTGVPPLLHSQVEAW